MKTKIRNLQEKILKQIDDKLGIKDLEQLNPYGNTQLEASLEAVISKKETSKLYKPLCKILKLEDETDINVGEVLEENKYWSNHLFMHMAITMAPFIPSPLSMVLRPAYSLGAAVFELFRLNFRKSFFHAFIATPSIVTKFGGAVYGIPIVAYEKKMLPVYIDASTKMTKNYLSGDDYQELIRQAETHQIGEFGKHVRNRYRLRVIGETLFIVGLAYGIHILEAPPVIPVYHDLLKQITPYIQEVVNGAYKVGFWTSLIFSFPALYVGVKDSYRLSKIGKINANLDI